MANEPNARLASWVSLGDVRLQHTLGSRSSIHRGGPLYLYLLSGSNSAIKRHCYCRLFTKDRDMFRVSTFYPHPLSVNPHVYRVMTQELFF